MLIFLFGFATGPIQAADQDLANPAAPATSAASIPQRGTLYRVRYHGHTSYLFGTIHVGRPEFFPLEAQATKALSEAGTLALELDLRDTS
ncbi:MAG TPA: TraB/GumN family protein, partial [Burkholderiaceae bacterium]|nr:TraB/GumN family protein [Burkholderiaceae bacterium]